MELAIHGGRQAVTATPPIKWPSVTVEEIRDAVELLASNNTWIANDSPPVGPLEERIRRLTGRRFALAMNSGTSALLACYFAAGIDWLDEVIVPAYTHHQTASPMFRVGGVPVLADIDPQTWTLDPNSVRERITPRTKAVVANHTWGNPCDMDALLALCREFGLMLIEDAAHAPGGSYKGRPIGGIGDCAAFSFQAFKPISAGEGGVFVTDDEELFRRAALLAPRELKDAVSEEGLWTGPIGFSTTGIGYKLRIAPVEAALALRQTTTLAERNDLRMRNMAALATGIADLPGVTLQTPQHGSTHTYYAFRIACDKRTLGLEPADIVRLLRAEGVVVNIPDTVPLHMLPLFQGGKEREALGWPFSQIDYARGVQAKDRQFPVTDGLVPQLISIRPLLHPALDVVDQYVEAFRKVWEWALARRCSD